MVKNLLLPYRFKRIGWGLLIFTILFILLLFPVFNTWELLHWSWSRPLTHAAMIGGMIAACLITLSKEKIEDEYIASIRAQTMAAIFYLFFVLSIGWMVANTLHIARWAELSRENNLKWFTLVPMQITNIWFAFGCYIVVFNIRLWWLKTKARNAE